MGEGFRLRRIFVGDAVCGQKLIRYYLLEYDTAGRACYGIQVEVGREKTVIPRITPAHPHPASAQGTDATGAGGAADPGVCDPGDGPGRGGGLAADVSPDCPLQFSGRFCIIKFCF